MMHSGQSPRLGDLQVVPYSLHIAKWSSGLSGAPSIRRLLIASAKYSKGFLKSHFPRHKKVMI